MVSDRTREKISVGLGRVASVMAGLMLGTALSPALSPTVRNALEQALGRAPGGGETPQVILATATEVPPTFDEFASITLAAQLTEIAEQVETAVAATQAAAVAATQAVEAEMSTQTARDQALQTQAYATALHEVAGTMTAEYTPPPTATPTLAASPTLVPTASLYTLEPAGQHIPWTPVRDAGGRCVIAEAIAVDPDDVSQTHRVYNVAAPSLPLSFVSIAGIIGQAQEEIYRQLNVEDGCDYGPLRAVLFGRFFVDSAVTGSGLSAVEIQAEINPNDFSVSYDLLRVTLYTPLQSLAEEDLQSLQQLLRVYIMLGVDAVFLNSSLPEQGHNREIIIILPGTEASATDSAVYLDHAVLDAWLQESTASTPEARMGQALSGLYASLSRDIEILQAASPQPLGPVNLTIFTDSCQDQQYDVRVTIGAMGDSPALTEVGKVLGNIPAGTGYCPPR